MQSWYPDQSPNCFHSGSISVRNGLFYLFGQLFVFDPYPNMIMARIAKTGINFSKATSGLFVAEKIMETS
jgi:hypothetical protein